MAESRLKIYLHFTKVVLQALTPNRFPTPALLRAILVLLPATVWGIPGGHQAELTPIFISYRIKSKSRAVAEKRG